MADIRSGERFGPLAFTGDEIEIGKELGSGSAAKVYACTRVRTGEELAVKAVDLDRLKLCEDAEAQLQKIEQEVQILRELRNDRCVGLYDIVRTQRWCMIVMERLSGGDLFECIVRNRRFSEPQARHVFRQILEGVEYMHSRKIIHRDIKPENILVAGSKRENGDEMFDVKIADFGLSKLISAIEPPKTVVGTPQYWAPEVLDANPYDIRADLWSLGAVLFVMLAGKYPFNAKGKALEDQIRRGACDLAGGVWKNVSSDATDLIRGLLQVDRGDRLSLQDCFRHVWMTGGNPGIVGAKRPAVENGTVMPVTAPAGMDSTSKNPRLEISTSPKQSPRHSDSSNVNCAVKSNGGEFCLDELLHLQLSIASSLNIAYLSCRHSNPKLSSTIQKAGYQARSLSQRTLRVVGQYAQVAQQVGTKILPDLKLAVQEAAPELAVDLLATVKTWVAQMCVDGHETARLCVALSEELHELIGLAKQEGAIPLAEVGNATLQALTAPGGDGAALHPSAQELLKNLKVLGPTSNPDALSPVISPRSNFLSRDIEEHKKDLLELLFMTPGSEPVLQANFHGNSLGRIRSSVECQIEEVRSRPSTASCMVEELRTSSSQGGNNGMQVDTDTPAPLIQSPHGSDHEDCNDPDVSPQGPPEILVPEDSESVGTDNQIALLPRQRRQEHYGQRAQPLLRALRELRRVEQILQSCTAFWANMDGTVQQLSLMKDHTECLVKHAANNARLRNRFEERLSEYEQFWSSLHTLCNGYCTKVSSGLKQMYDFIKDVEDSIDVVDMAAVISRSPELDRKAGYA